MPRPSNLSEEGKILRQYLFERQMTQVQFAKEIGVTDSYIGAWANGVKGMSYRKMFDLLPQDLVIRILNHRIQCLRDLMTKAIKGERPMIVRGKYFYLERAL